MNAGKLLLPPGLFSQLESQRRGRQWLQSSASAAAAGGGGAVGDRPGVCPLAPWDIGRCMVHGKFDATLAGGERAYRITRMLPATTINLKECSGLVCWFFGGGGSFLLLYFSILLVAPFFYHFWSFFIFYYFSFFFSLCFTLV